ncbi:uncharacterized protein PHALS_03476 [Plasmopara halstedii]|uniref:Uncharacterized protein n=1 Tax=Plasmopara halstedii TaxID=4781 RepID=A0A0N7L7D8_PLAHL|nr:uncharacterized protein PHALS_03476 [Plasmopara halstedii]CEG46795.1 hypothetical protein PHALS_03476 [Plasmopara halstedii]|eukprot:XP_024583164.1 hypothetical protein PHALS_03476 [Plasmopara halstedii]
MSALCVDRRATTHPAIPLNAASSNKDRLFQSAGKTREFIPDMEKHLSDSTQRQVLGLDRHLLMEVG